MQFLSWMRAEWIIPNYLHFFGFILDIINTSCLGSHIKVFPPHTTPAGYTCPACPNPAWLFIFIFMEADQSFIYFHSFLLFFNELIVVAFLYYSLVMYLQTVRFITTFCWNFLRQVCMYRICVLFLLYQKLQIRRDSC